MYFLNINLSIEWLFLKYFLLNVKKEKKIELMIEEFSRDITTATN